MKAVVLIIIFLTYASNSVANDTIRIAYFNVPPHMIYDSEKEKLVSSAVYDLIEKFIAPKMGVKFDWQQTPTNIPRQLASLSSETIDASALLIYSSERSKKFIFTKEAYIHSSSAIAVLKTSSLQSINKVEDILGLKIGYAAKSFLSPFMRDKRIKLDLISSPHFNNHNFKKLLAGRIDGVYAPDKAGLLMVMKEMSLENKVRVISLPEEAVNFHVVFSKNNKEMAQRFDQAFAELDGRILYLKLLSKYLDITKF